jgi:hypothetical protein
MDSTVFELEDVLSVTTGRPISPRGVAAVYGVLQFMTGCQILEHELEPAREVCRQTLFLSHPWLKQYNAWACQARHVEQMVAAMAQLRGNSGIVIRQMPRGAWSPAKPRISMGGPR